MAELSLHGHEAALVNLADEQRMPNIRLADHVSKLEAIRASAIELGIGRQATQAARLLRHFQFEQSRRVGVATADFDAVVSGQGFEAEVLAGSSATA